MRLNGGMPRPPNSLGTRLALAMQQRGMIQTELARLSGLKQPNISKLKRGDTASTAAIARLAAALQVPVRWLELGEGDEPNWSQPFAESVPAAPSYLWPFDHVPMADYFDLDPVSQGVFQQRMRDELAKLKAAKEPKSLGGSPTEKEERRPLTGLAA